jgi:hypothetical protein
VSARQQQLDSGGRVMARKAAFSANMVECSADGSNSAMAITRPKKVVFGEQGILLGSDRVPYSAIVETSIRGNVLSIALRGPGNRRLERHFRYDTFLPGTGVRRLAELDTWLASRQPQAQSGPTPAPAIRAESVAGQPRFTVRVFGTQVAFPPVCPVCLAPGCQVAELPVSSGLDSGVWLVPVCADHRGLGNRVGVSGWSLKARHLTFSFERPDYGARFLDQNAGVAHPDPAEVRAALREIHTGTRFILFAYAVSLIVVSFKRRSGICAVAPGRSPVLVGLPYSLLTLGFGWWGIPHGPIFTISALATNLRGGVDLTSTLAAAIRGQRFAALPR